MQSNESYFLTNEDGKPLCEVCNINPIVAEDGDGKWKCLRCFLEEYGTLDTDLVEEDDSLIVCQTELERQMSQ